VAKRAAVAAGDASILCRVRARLLYHFSNARFSRHSATQAYAATAIKIRTQSATTFDPAMVSNTRSSAAHPVRCSAGFHHPSANGDQSGQFPYASQLIHCAPPIRNGAQITGIKARANPIWTAARIPLGSFTRMTAVYLTSESGTVREVAFASTQGLRERRFFRLRSDVRKLFPPGPQRSPGGPPPQAAQPPFIASTLYGVVTYL